MQAFLGRFMQNFALSPQKLACRLKAAAHRQHLKNLRRRKRKLEARRCVQPQAGPLPASWGAIAGGGPLDGKPAVQSRLSHFFPEAKQLERRAAERVEFKNRQAQLALYQAAEIKQSLQAVAEAHVQEKRPKYHPGREAVPRRTLQTVVAFTVGIAAIACSRA